VILTPPQTAGILDGINRKSIIQIARDLGYEVVERDLARAEVYLADEVFMSGTAAELVPVCEIDDHAIGQGVSGAVTRAVQSVFLDALHGRDARYREWLDVVKVPSRSAP
jgi:branched-chain amino acid aminotransferase